MDDLQEKVHQLSEIWQKVYTAMIVNPQAWKPYLPYSSPQEINEVVSTVATMLDRSRAPVGFSPVFRIIRGFASTAVNSALDSVQSLQNAKWQSLPSFLLSLNQILSAFHSMLYHTESDEARRSIETLGGKLAESLALLDTAQRELSEKAKSLEKSEELAETIEQKGESVEAIHSSIQEVSNAVATLKAQAEEDAAAIEETEVAAQSLKKQLEAQIAVNAKLQESLNKQASTLDELQQQSADQDKLIRELLPGAASAGLAHAFGSKASKLDTTKWIWMIVFMFSILCLVAMTGVILFQNTHASEELWKIVLQRIPLAAPLVWLGWFSAVQYGNTVRVQEDYAFKEATSKAFVGYKDHMQQLADTEAEDTKSALTMLATNTLQILAREPLRIYQKSTEDVSPTKALFEGAKILARKKDPE